eukprot:5641927-Prymnesium_polylepis.1
MARAAGPSSVSTHICSRLAASSAAATSALYVGGSVPFSPTSTTTSPVSLTPIDTSAIHSSVAASVEG